MEDQKYAAEQHDEWVQPRAEFMYNYLDYGHDRAKVRERFLNEMNKKTTIEDIGLILDDFVLSSKANLGEFYNPAQHLLEQPESGKTDQT